MLSAEAIEAIEEFKKLYEKIYKVKLSNEEASFRAGNLIRLYEAVYQSKGEIKTKLKKPE